MAGWRWDLNSVALRNLFNKSSESTYIVSVKFDGDLISDLISDLSDSNFRLELELKIFRKCYPTLGSSVRRHSMV